MQVTNYSQKEIQRTLWFIRLHCSVLVGACLLSFDGLATTNKCHRTLFRDIIVHSSGPKNHKLNVVARIACHSGLLVPWRNTIESDHTVSFLWKGNRRAFEWLIQAL